MHEISEIRATLHNHHDKKFNMEGIWDIIYIGSIWFKRDKILFKISEACR